MNSTTFKATNKTKKIHKEKSIQVSKKQIFNVFVLILVLTFLLVDFLALKYKTPLLKELLIAQIIIAFMGFIKIYKSSSILK